MTDFDLSPAKAAAVEAAEHWGLELGPPFSLSNVSYVAPAGDVVVKVAVIRGAYLRPALAARIRTLL